MSRCTVSKIIHSSVCCSSRSVTFLTAPKVRRQLLHLSFIVTECVSSATTLQQRVQDTRLRDRRKQDLTTEVL